MPAYEYIERPPTSVAVQFDGHEQSIGDIIDLFDSIKSWSMGNAVGKVRSLTVDCESGAVIALTNDWVVRDSGGGIHVYKDTEFRKKFMIQR